MFQPLRQWIVGLSLMLCMSAAVTQAQQTQGLENAKINYLLQTIASLEGAQFIRNGTAYTAAEAEAHLRMKWNAAGKRVSTAQDFIRYCATESSVSGLPYQIRWLDGRTMVAADFLNQKLSEYVPPGVVDQ